jgi:hypothetical protein
MFYLMLISLVGDGGKEPDSLDFAQAARSIMVVFATRSRLFACLALLLWATVGVLAVEHCSCEEVTADCEHAGEACALPDDCSDCLVPSAPVALLPPANVLSEVGVMLVFFSYVTRSAVELAEPLFSSPSQPSRPPAFRAGTMCLRI